MIDWSTYLACSRCAVGRGEPCYRLLAIGPEAMPSKLADKPCSCRRLRADLRTAPTARPAARATGSGAANVARRTARRQEGVAKSWAAVARRQGKM